MELSEKLISWFLKEARNLPWRNTRNPYHIWLSEVILQQTRVQQGLSYYHRFIEHFPDLPDLAAASEEEVLGIWQGLGYYSRGRNLLETARNIMEKHKGVFPDSYHQLIQLKGIGPYTAAAVAAFAFNENVMAVDGNVIRVICRLFGVEEDVRKSSTRKQIDAIAKELLPKGKAWEFNQAMMEFGATLCKPGRPNCNQCPVTIHCVAFKKKVQDRLPYKSKPNPKHTRYFQYLLVFCNGQFAFRKRDQKDIWQGLFEPALQETNTADAWESQPNFLFSSIASFQPELCRQLKPRKCLLSHQEIHIRTWLFLPKTKPILNGFRWVSMDEIQSLPKPVIFSKILPEALSALYI